MHFYILAGGKSRRLGGNKALFVIGGTSVIERVVAAIPKGSPVFLVTNSPTAYAHLSMPTLPDNFPGAGPLAGIQAGLVHSPHEWNFFLACDFPCLRPSAINEICAAPRLRQVILPATSRFSFDHQIKSNHDLQPLCALWSKSTLPVIEAALRNEELSVTSVLEKLSLHCISISEPEALFNLNTPEDLMTLRAWIHN
jgi:molybdopterin-guanine dinucleotide biosynthesis protein A